MSISGAQWGAASDPFIMATALSLSSWVDISTVGQQRLTFNITGALDVVTDDPDIQEVVLQEVAAPYREVRIPEFRLTVSASTEFDDLEWIETPQGNPRGRVMVPLVGADTSTAAQASYEPISSGPLPVRLVFRTGYAWKEKDPAQLITSWLQHYVRSDVDLSLHMDEDSFADASADFDAIDQLKMSCVREVGLSIMETVEKAMRQTVDFLATRPNETTGAMAMHYIRRDLAVKRDNVIDLDNDIDVEDWSGGSDAALIVDSIAYTYGNYARRLAGLIYQDVDEGKSWEYTSPMNLASTEDRDVWTRRASGDELKIDFPWVMNRFGLERHWDMGFWAHEQEEITFSMGPRHFNFEVGDVVKVSCASFGLDEASMLVLEKDVDLDDLGATITVRRAYGFAGARPHRVWPDLSLWYKAETLGRQPHLTSILRPSATWTPPTSQQTRLRDLANGWHAEIDTLDPDEQNITTDEFPGTVPNDWSAWNANSAGLVIPDADGALVERVCIVVMRSTASIGISDNTLLHSTDGVTNSATVSIYRVASAGATVYANGGYNPGALLDYSAGRWHTWSFARGVVSIREDGVELVAGSAGSHPHFLDTSNTWLQSEGAGSNADGARACTEFIVGAASGGITVADVELVEAYLREKYRHY